MRKNIIIGIIFLLSVCISLFFMSHYLFKDTTPTIIEEKEKEQPQPIITNDNYIQTPPQQTEVITLPQLTPPLYENIVKQYTTSFISKFKINHAHSHIFKCIKDFIIEKQGNQHPECDLVFHIFEHCHSLSIPVKLDLAVYVIWKSQDQPQIDNVYQTIIAIANDDKQDNRIRANAIEILTRSNNTRYINQSKRIMDKLKQKETIEQVNEIRRNMDTIRNTIQTQLPIPTSTLQSHVPFTPEEIRLQQVLLDQYQRLERRAHNVIKHKKTIYDDTQNVHNHDINDSVIDSALQLIQRQTTPSAVSIDIERELSVHYNNYQENLSKITESLKRIRNDPSKFKKGITINDVFNKVVAIISQSPHKNELIQRLGEELVDMNNLCATGHLSRIINILQGFDETIHIKINPKDEIYANINNFITMSIQQSGESETLLESMMNDNKNVYLDFVALIMKPKITELKTDYKNIITERELQQSIKDGLKNFLKDDNDTAHVVNLLSDELSSSS